MNTNIVDNNLFQQNVHSNRVIGIKTKSYLKNHNNIVIKSNFQENVGDDISDFSNKVIGIKTKSYSQHNKKDIFNHTYVAYQEYKNELSKCEKVITHLKKNKRKYQTLVVLVALLIPTSTLKAYALASNSTNLSIKVYKMGKDIGKLICAIGIIAEASKCVLTGSLDQLGKIGVKYLAFGLLIRYLQDIVTWVFN